MEILTVLIALVVVGFGVRLLVRRITVLDYQRALRYDAGVLRGVLEAGTYWVIAPRTRVEMVDMRERITTVGGQEVLSADGVSLKVSLAAWYAVADPQQALNTVRDYEDALYVVLQLALRDIVASTTAEQLVERQEIGSLLYENAAGAAEGLGLKLRAVELKDVLVPGKLKRLFAMTLQARKEAQAMLERTRAETAALRSLTNAARMVQQNPALLQLRLLQQLGESSGNTIVVGLNGSGISAEILPPNAESHPA
ncbi:MAG: hypothetical protein GEU81_03300 [Nitriliruptorales bacterium]|nr:hypothetical protein [Nitriliruptorales bacterium]